ncbi:MAG: hypothetical protein EOP53_11550 [Sphingobacteriales bacterium]|nr:MAG: hypothetical protein EOP53_11550 [Sphingobacteriales bacterium]
MNDSETKLRKRIKTWIITFIIFLALSGITAFPVETELRILLNNNLIPAFLQNWISNIYQAIKITNENFPYLAYGYDWLAFAHLVISVAFIGPLRDPVRNIWVIQFGMIACLMVFPLAFIAGPIRQIPLYWQIIDCSFGVFGLIPLYICYKKIRNLEAIEAGQK